MPSVPQQALLEHVDLMVHHGGNNSFTECVRAGVPALVLPFSSDQFSVARDAERSGAGVVADPNAPGLAEIGDALEALSVTAGPRVAELADRVREHGPRWGAARLLTVMRERAPARQAQRPQAQTHQVPGNDTGVPNRTGTPGAYNTLTGASLGRDRPAAAMSESSQPSREQRRKDHSGWVLGR